MGKPSHISYTGVVLDNKSRSILLKKVPVPTGDGWNTICHHMTICMGQMSKDDLKYVGKKVELKVVAMDRDDRVMAVKVSVPEFLDVIGEVPHITMAVNSAMDGKPGHSKELGKWIPVKNFTIQGTITEI